MNDETREFPAIAPEPNHAGTAGKIWRRRRGRRRGPRSMGRYPFLTHLRRFVSETRPFYSPLSLREIERKLRYVNRILGELKARGLVGTTNPEGLTQADVGAFVEWMNARDGLRARPLQPGSQVNLLKHLKVFLEFVGNPVIGQMKARRLLRPPRLATGPLPSPSEAQVVEILRRLQDAAAGDRYALGVFGIVALCASAGVRLKEARLAVKADLSTTHWELTVMHPKGEGSWGARRVAKVVGPGRQALADYLDLRSSALRGRGIADTRDAPLVPYFTPGGGVAVWDDAYLHKVKVKVETRLGLRFDFRQLRRSFGQSALDRGARIDTVSVALGHANTKTTETYYARRKVQDAFDELERVWVATPVVQKTAD